LNALHILELLKKDVIIVIYRIGQDLQQKSALKAWNWGGVSPQEKSKDYINAKRVIVVN